MRKKKESVAIVTIHSINYGNRLQNYALQEILKSYGLMVETLRRGQRPEFKACAKKKIKNAVKILIGNVEGKFLRFDNTIKWSKFYLGSDTAPDSLKSEYDYFIAGSDQVWNPYYDFVGKSDLLYFAKHEQKISYAASFGVRELPENVQSLYTDCLSDFHRISVREDDGIRIVRELTGREAKVTLDPTLMLTADQWRGISKRTKLKPKAPYALVYFLGEWCDDYKKAVQDIKAQGYEVFDVLAKGNDGKRIAIGPQEFLYLLDNASIILTNSFHASVFSILFHKKLRTFRRPGMDMSSRLDTLFQMVGLQDCRNEQGIYVIDKEEIYMKCDTILEDKRKESLDFLNDSLGGGKHHYSHI